MGKTKCPQCGSRSHHSCEVKKDLINGLQIFDKDIESELEEQLEALIEDLQPLLLAHLDKKREPFKPLMIRVRILGTDEASAKPWIVVHCPSVVVKDVETFFMKDIARTMFADMDIADSLEVAFVGRPIRTRAGRITEVEVSFASADVNLPQPWSGPIILAQHPHTHRATMGGMLVVDNQQIESIFGLTVGHLLHHGNGNGLQRSDEETVVTVHDQEIASVTARSRPLGSIIDASFSEDARDLDWALIQFSETTQLSDFVSEKPKYEKFSEGNCKGPVTFRPNPLPYGSAKLSSLPASVILPVGEKFIKVYPIVISGVQGFELPAGTSGCWVTTESSGSNAEHDSFGEVAVHGIIVADDCFGDIYMVPLDEIMVSMEKALSGMSVSLPTDTFEIVRLLHEQSFRMDAQTVDRQLVSTIDISKIELHDPLIFSTGTQPPPPAPPPVPAFTNPPPAIAGPSNSAQVQTPSRGWSKAIWFCSDCGDGPSQPWNMHCANCGHVRCSACNVEEA